MSNSRQFDSLRVALDHLHRFPDHCLFPAGAGTKRPLLKTPENDRTQHYLNVASNDPEQIAKWSNQFPGCWWGLAAKKSGLLIADIDAGEKHGRVSLRKLEAEGFTLPRSYTQITPRGGKHIIMKGPHRFSASKIGLDIDTPNHVIIAGCGDYREYSGASKTIADAPLWLIDKLAPRKNDTPREASAEDVKLDVFQRMLKATPYTGGPVGLDDRHRYSGWLNFLFACHEAAGGDEAEYLWAFIEWSLADPNPDWKHETSAELIEAKWCGANDNRSDAATRGSWFKVLKHFGHSDLVGEALGDQQQQADNESFMEDAKDYADADVGNEQPLSRADRPTIYSLEEICENWVWVSTLKRFVSRDDPLLAHDKEAFNDKFRYAKPKKAKSVAEYLFARSTRTIRKLDRMVYMPNAPEFPNDGLWNQWRKSPIEPIEGDTTLFHEHLEFLFPREADRTHLLNWMAAVLQHLETKPRHQLLIIGKIQRTGKSFFSRLMAKLVGESNWQPLTQDIIANGFTGWATHTKLVTVEEVRDIDRRQITSKLHVWASESAITVNEKMLPTFRMEQAIAMMLNSNKDDPLGLDDSDGRYLVLRTNAKPHADGRAYYDALYGVNKIGGILQTPALLSAILYELLHRDLKGYSIEQPAPFTVAKAKVIEAGSSEVELWMLDHKGTWPLSCRVVEIDTVMGALPRFMHGRSGTYKAVQEGLRKRFNGAPWPDQIRPDGRRGEKVRVWTLVEPSVVKSLTSADVMRMYREDQAAHSAAAASRPGDFDDDGEGDLLRLH